MMDNGRRALLLVVAAMLVGACSSAGQAQSGPTTPERHPITLFADRFDRPDGLVTNEYAYWNPARRNALRSARWEMTSGSLFVKDHAGWTGIPDDRAPDPHSRLGNNSAVFRLTTKRADFRNVTISMRLRPLGFTQTPTTPSVAWDGIHVFVHYRNQRSLYYASVYRRDGHIDIKKKVPGGTTNGGTYYTLASGKYSISLGQWTSVSVTVGKTDSGAERIAIIIGGRQVLSATDTGTHGPPITSGKVGLRGDNCNFLFDDFVVTQL
jgi:hypothetical protein